MGLFNRLQIRCSRWTKNALINHEKAKSVPYPCIQMVFVHQGIIADTLLCRFFKFFETCPKYKKLVVKCEDFDHLREKFVITDGLLSEFEKDCSKIDDSRQFTSSVRKLPLAELLQLILFLKEANIVEHSNHKKALIRALDGTCCEKIPHLSVEEALRLNYCWLGVVGTRVKFLKSFNLLMDNFRSHIEEKTTKTSAVVLMMFCSSIARKDAKAKEIVSLGLNCICKDNRRLVSLSTTEIVLISEVAFKTGSKIISPIFIEQLVKTVLKDIVKFAKDPAHLVVVFKAMRHNKIYDWNLLKGIQKCLVQDKCILNLYNFAGITHLIALYADALYGDQEFINYLIDSAISITSDVYVYNPYNEKGKGRAKDMARLLWATSYLGFKIDENVLEKKIMPIIMEKITGGVYNKQLHVLIDTVLSLWIMGYKPLDLLPFVFTEEMKKYLYETNNVRYKARLQLLLTCISIESPETMNCANMENIHVGEAYNPGENKLLKQRPFLKRVFQDVRSTVGMSDFINVTCENSLPNLNIPGILLTINNNNSRKLIYIEVVDDTNCLHESDTPNGLILLKLRLLRKLGHHVILVNYCDYGNQHSRIMLQIEDEIKDIQQH